MKKIVISILSALAGAIIGANIVSKTANASIDKVKSMSDKHLTLFLMMNQWVKIKQEGKNLVSYFEKNSYKKIAIYGMGYVGETLLNEIKESDIIVAYGIDKNIDLCYVDLDIVSLNDVLETVDVVVVTAITFFDEIKVNISEKLNCPIISLEDILYEV